LGIYVYLFEDKKRLCNLILYLILGINLPNTEFYYVYMIKKHSTY